MSQLAAEFCTLCKLGDDLFSVNVNEGIEVTSKRLQALHSAILTQNNNQPFKLLVERTNSYCFSYSGMEDVGNHDLIKAIAVWVENPEKEETAKLHEFFPRKRNCPLAIFLDRHEALSWLSTF